MHAILAILWVLSAIPTLIWWRNSIAWLIFISIYANVAGHWSAVEAATPQDT